MELQQFNPGDLILQEGNESDVVYEVQSGEVEIFALIENRPVVLGIVTAGEFLGEMGIVEHRPRGASARARTEVVARVLNELDFVRLMSESPASAQRLIHRLSERLRGQNRKLIEAAFLQPKLPDARHPGAASALDAAGEGTKPRAETFRVTLAPAFQTPYVSPEGVVIREFPYAIGRQRRSREAGTSEPIDLALPDVSPFRLSRQHFSLSHNASRYDASGYFVQDLGSRLGTRVNGEFLGHHFAKDHKNLRLGDNTVTAGGMDSPYTFSVRIEKD